MGGEWGEEMGVNGGRKWGGKGGFGVNLGGKRGILRTWSGDFGVKKGDFGEFFLGGGVGGR